MVIIMNENIRSKEYYVSSIDLLGMKNAIQSDSDDSTLNSIHKIYKSWNKIFKNIYFDSLEIKFFSDNFVIAIETKKPSAADKIIEATALICEHLFICGYKPRGGISKGLFYIDNIFVLGQGLLNAYFLESKQAVKPKIVIDYKVVENVSECLRTKMIFSDDDGKTCLNYLRSFGKNREQRLNDISEIIKSLTSELDDIIKLVEEGIDVDENKKIMEKLTYLLEFAKNTKNLEEKKN